MVDIDRNGSCTQRHNTEISAKFFRAESLLEMTHEQEIIQVKINTEQQHEYRCHHLHIGTVVCADAQPPVAEAAGAGRSK